MSIEKITIDVWSEVSRNLIDDLWLESRLVPCDAISNGLDDVIQAPVWVDMKYKTAMVILKYEHWE